jgi:hypothetical protein
MASYDDMIIHHFMEKEANVVIEEDEHLTILA